MTSPSSHSSDPSSLFANTGFILLLGLSPHSEVSIDSSSSQAIKRFSGWKLVPPGLHFVTFSPASSSDTPGANEEIRRAERIGLAIRRGVWKQVNAGRTVVLRYSNDLEALEETAESDVGEDVEEVVGIDRLRGLDDQLAPYDGNTELWPDLSSKIDVDLVRSVLGKTATADTLSESTLDESLETSKSKMQNIEALNGDAAATSVEGTLHFPAFDLRRSWRTGAVGEEVTRYSKDKSWLLRDVVARHCSGGESIEAFDVFWDSLLISASPDPFILLGHLQLAFLLFLQLHNYSSLLVYKRLLTLCCQSSSMLVDKELSIDIKHDAWPSFYRDLLQTLKAQLSLLPNDFFTDSPDAGLENMLILQLVSVSQNLMSGVTSLSDADKWDIAKASEQLRKVAERRFGWQLPKWREKLDVVMPTSMHQDAAMIDDGESDYEEEGEDAPVVVEL